MSSNAKHHVVQHLDYKPIQWRKTAKCKQSPVQQQLNKDNSDMEL